MRFGFGLEHDSAKIQAKMSAIVREAGPDTEVTFEAFRAKAWHNEPSGPFPELLGASYVAEFSEKIRPAVFTATTDARYVAGPCLCFGPIADNLHGKDEWVDIESLVRTATIVASTAAAWLA